MNKIMKSAIIFKQMFIAMAALTMVGCLSSCRDQDFDWDTAHANTAQAKFTDAFVKAYGKPADDHQWGFDMAWANQSETRSVESNCDLVVIKPDPGDEEYSYIKTYGQVPDITQREHQEVYDWFCKHKVTWQNTTKVVGVYYYYDGEVPSTLNVPSDLNKYKVYNADDEEVTISADQKTGVGPLKNCTIKDEDGNIIEKVTQGNILIYGSDKGCLIVKTVYFDGTNLTRDENLTAVSTGELMSGNSIKDNMSFEYWSYPGSVGVGTRMKATNIWLQHVASENDADSNADVYSKYFNSGVDEYAFDFTQAVAAKHMDYLQIYGVNGEKPHTNDYNAGNGYGWGLADDVGANGNYPGVKLRRNGELILGVNMNNMSIHNSVDEKLHDKWILVYLKGDGYEGYYLGFDLEGADLGLGLDKHFTANGYCNDWIFKITSITQKPTSIRIMCEDLGGIDNSVNTGSRVMISDIDYNDIVLDVDQDGQEVTLTLQAAGGTLPLTVWYDDNILFETHELFEKDKLYPESYKADYKVMYRTGNDTKDASAKPVKMYFTGTNQYNTYISFVNNENDKYFTSAANFDWNKLAIKVYRFDADNYRTSSSDFSNNVELAAWVNLTNIRGEAPLKICVPQTVRWLKERVAIHEGYPYFENWVRDQGDYFWDNDKTINLQNLY